MASHKSPPATRSKGAPTRGSKRKAPASLASELSPMVDEQDSAEVVDSEHVHGRDNVDDWSNLDKSNLDEWNIKPDEPLSLPSGPTVAVPAEIKT